MGKHTDRQFLRSMGEPRKKREIILEELDFIWDEAELRELKEMWRAGISGEKMARHFSREDDEIALAIMHLKRMNHINRRAGGFFGSSTS